MQIGSINVPDRLPTRGLVLAAVGALATAAFPETAIEAAKFALWNLLLVAPVILIGVGLTAAATATGSMALIASAFEGRELRMIGVVSLIGALTPVCGISVLPLVAGLLAAGVPLAPIMAFWLSSPITDPGMLAITAAMLGMPFAIGKTVAAFMIGIFGGLATLLFIRAGYLQSPAKSSAHLRKARGQSCASGEASEVMWAFWKDHGRVETFRETAIDTGRLMLIWLTAAFVAEYFLKLYVPDVLITQVVGGDNAWAVPIAATIGAPIYLDGYGALPVIRGLIDTGMRPDAAMAFLIAGGITSAWAAIPVFALVRLPIFFFYLTLAVFGSMLAGWVFGLLV